MPSKCVCRICNIPVECGEMLCPVCELDYGDAIFHCEGGHCDVDLQKIAQRVRRIREKNEQRVDSGVTSLS